MAKKRQNATSAFNNTTKEELKEIGKSILNKAEGKETPVKPPPVKVKAEPITKTVKKSPKSSTKKKKAEPKSKNKLIYVSVETHRLARRQSVMKDMNIKEYITHLIEQDQN